MNQYYALNELKQLKALVYAMVCKYPDGIEINRVMIEDYMSGQYENEVEISENPQRGTFIIYRKIK